MNKTQIKIALITDANYFFPALVTIRSVLKNTINKTDIRCILTEKVNFNLKEIENELERSYPNSSVEFIYYDDSKLSHVKPKFHVSRAAYVKIYLPEILSDWSKCIFLDSDLLIRKDIRILWENALKSNSGKEVAAVWNPGYNKDNAVMGLKLTDRTFNSGVLVMDLDLMRKNKSSLKLEDFIKNYNHLTVLNDQAAFNAVYKNSWEDIPLEWNAQFLLYLRRAKKIGVEKKELKKIRKEPAVLHFTTSSKPWKYRSMHPFKAEFLKYFNSIEGSKYLGKITLLDTIKRFREAFLLFKGRF